MNEELISLIAEFDPSDNYHDKDRAYDDFSAGYYAALERVDRLLKGEIKNWRDVE